MIVSRTSELSRLDAVLDGLATGQGSALVVHGEAGIGKTTLLEALILRSRGTAAVVRARGAETEAELAFSALADLLEPVLGELAALPAPQAAALRGALALGPPVTGPPAPGDRLAVCVATLGVLRAAARHRPVLAVVDDLQWVDASSRECIEYVARRAGGSLAVVLAARDPWYPPERAGLPELRVGPVDEAGAAALLRYRAPGLAPSVAAAITHAAAGNPLALVELPETLTAGQRAGTAAMTLPLAPGGRLQRAFSGRVGALDAAARRALLIAAAHAGSDLPVIAAACLQAGTDLRHLCDAEASGLVRIEAGRLSFTHPLIRGLVYTEAPASERRVAHAALAAALRDDDDRQVWHRAAAAIGADEEVAAGLERVGGQAVARRAYAAGSGALERAARLTPDPDAAGGRLISAGQAAAGAGMADRALALLAEAAEVSRDDDQRARAQQLRGRMLVWRGRGAEATSLLVSQAGLVVSRRPALAAVMYSDASSGATTTGSYLEAERLARRAAGLLRDRAAWDAGVHRTAAPGPAGHVAAGPMPAGPGPAGHGAVLATLCWALCLRGKAPEARLVLGEATRLARGLDPLGPDWPWLHMIRQCHIPLWDFERARAESLGLAQRARDAGALAALSGLLQVVADTAFRLGDWDAADAAALEAIGVAGEVGQPVVTGWALAIRTRILAARGRREESLAAAQAARHIAESERIDAGLRFVHAALGFGELGLDRTGAAITELETAECLVRGTGMEEPTIVPWAPDLIEAYARQGRDDDARRVLTALERQAASTASPVAGAAAARCRGMVDDDYEPAFARALALDDRRPMPFERARTLLAFGRRLHRSRRRAEARDRLRAALDGFEQRGADAWAAQAQAELRAAGARRRADTDSSALTAQELRVAAAVRRGASNRAIAAELFLSPKTVEFHLRQIYRKLGLHSRTQLAAALAARPETAEMR
jgi:DNA-binding CsgD family transcriptional regulator